MQELGTQNQDWLQAIVKAIDQQWCGLSGSEVEKCLTEVYRYLDKSVVRKALTKILQEALTDESTSEVGHPPGNFVGCNLLVAKAPQMRFAS